ncbi:MAG: hypothetical protein JWL64_1694, partial [Frankiales bacterium]|nr:hypothetical protein [Frankiales bacterium]
NAGDAANVTYPQWRAKDAAGIADALEAFLTG